MPTCDLNFNWIDSWLLRNHIINATMQINFYNNKDFQAQQVIHNTVAIQSWYKLL